MTAQDHLPFSTYRFFTVDEGGVVLSDRSVDCLDDDEARALAATLFVGNTIEVWDVARLVGSCAVSH